MAETVYSAQENRVINRAKLPNENRATALIGKVRGVKPQIDIERGLYFTRSFRETEGEPLILRWAKALKKYAEESTVSIEEGQLIVGRAGKAGRYGILYPELDGDTLGINIEKLPGRATSPFDISAEDARIVKEEIENSLRLAELCEHISRGTGGFAAGGYPQTDLQSGRGKLLPVYCE